MSIRKPFLAVAVFAIIIIAAFFMLPQTAQAATHIITGNNQITVLSGDTVTTNGAAVTSTFSGAPIVVDATSGDVAFTLKDIDLTAANLKDAIYITGSNNCTITLDGTVKLTATGNFTAAIWHNGTGNIIIEGTAAAGSAFTGGYYGIYAERSVTIASGAVINGEIKGASGIVAKGSVTINGTTGAITGTGAYDHGVYAVGDVTINGTTGAITGGNYGIYAFGGSVKIGGTTGAITGTYNYGIYASDGVIIEQTAVINGAIKGGDSGINVYGGDVTIKGTTGAITGTNLYGIYVAPLTYRSVTITGPVASISGAVNAVVAKSYAIYDYVGVGSILDISTCNPGGHTVEFDYGTGATTTGLPYCVYVSGGDKIPDYDTATGFDVGWYTVPGTPPITPWDFSSDTVTTNTTLYTGDSWGPVVTTTLPSGVVGMPYSQTLAVGTGAITVALDAGSDPLPDGLSITGTSLTGTPTTPGTYNNLIIKAESGTNSDTQTITLEIYAAPVPPPPGPPTNPVGSSGFFVFTAPKAATRAASFPASGQVIGSRITVYKLETLKTTLYRLNKGEAFTVLGLANGGRALLIEKDGREGYVALKDIGFTLENPIKATALKKAAAYTKLSTGKLKRIGYYDKNQVLYVYGISGKYLINKQANATYYLDAGQWKLSLAQ